MWRLHMAPAAWRARAPAWRAGLRPVSGAAPPGSARASDTAAPPIQRRLQYSGASRASDTDVQDPAQANLPQTNASTCHDRQRVQPRNRADVRRHQDIPGAFGRRAAGRCRAAADAERARRFAEKARAENTKRAYRADWQAFRRWCRERGLAPLPARPETVAMYVSSVAERYKVSTLERKLAAISQAHKAAEVDSPALTSEEPLHSVWAGIVRSKTRAADKVAPALTEDIRQMIEHLPREGHLPREEPLPRENDARTAAGPSLSEDPPSNGSGPFSGPHMTQPSSSFTLSGLRDRALLLVGFAGALRRSELARLQVGDVAVTPEGLRLVVRQAKTDQEGRGLVKGIRYGEQRLTCPVRSLRDWCRAAGIDEGPIFRGVDRHGNVAGSALSGRSVARIVKRAARRAGLDPSQYSGHSLRAGFTTQAARAGTPERIIQRHTGHKDLRTLRTYIREGELFSEENPTGGLGL